MEGNYNIKKIALRQKQSLPLGGKIILAQQRIREWYEHWDGQVYISFSGGKDSTVLLHLVKEMYPDVPSVFVDTGLEYPEVRKFAIDRADVVLRPEMRFDRVIKERGYPVISKEVALTIRYARAGSQWAINNLEGKDRHGEPNTFKSRMYVKYRGLAYNAPFKISNECCAIMKERPMDKYAKETGRKAIIGIMASESRRRQDAYLKTGCNAFDGKKPVSKPLSVWTEQDILQYIKLKDIGIAPVYGDIVELGQRGELTTTGLSRTGCMFCMFGAQCEKAPNRFQRMRETHPKQYAYCMKPVEDGGLGLREVLEYIGVPYE